MDLELEVITAMSSLITLVWAISDSASHRAYFEEIDNVEKIYFLNIPLKNYVALKMDEVQTTQIISFMSSNPSDSDHLF